VSTDIFSTNPLILVNVSIIINFGFQYKYREK